MSRHKGYSLSVAAAISDQSGLFDEAFINLLLRPSVHYMRRGAVHLVWRSLRTEESFSQATDEKPSRQCRWIHLQFPLQCNLGLGAVCAQPRSDRKRKTLLDITCFPAVLETSSFPTHPEQAACPLKPRCVHALMGGKRYLSSRLIWLPTGPSLGLVTPYIGHVGLMNMVRIFKALYVSQPSRAAFACGFPPRCGQHFHPGRRALYTGRVTTVA